jgi:hypothetical protein
MDSKGIGYSMDVLRTLSSVALGVVAAIASATACTEGDTGSIDLTTSPAPPKPAPGPPRRAPVKPCVTDDTCEPATPHCDAAGACVECLVDQQCVDPKRPFCSAGRCVECVTTAECTTAGKPLCKLPDQRCVQCLVDGDCVAPDRAVCDPGPGNCVACRPGPGCDAGPCPAGMACGGP